MYCTAAIYKVGEVGGPLNLISLHKNKIMCSILRHNNNLSQRIRLYEGAMYYSSTIYKVGAVGVTVMKPRLLSVGTALGPLADLAFSEVNFFS